MKSPPTIKIPDALAGAPGKPKGKTNSHLSANIHAYAWSIPPDDRTGLTVTIGGMGHVVLSQHQPFTDAVFVVLHPVEALALHGILPAAIAAADDYRRRET